MADRGYAVAGAAPSYPTASLAAQAYLADEFRSQQALLAMQALAQIMAIWKQLGLQDVRASWPALRVALAAVIRQEFTVSVQQANAYFLQARLAAGVTAPPPVLAVPQAPEQALITATLDSTGPWGLLARLKDSAQTVPQAMDNAGTVMSGAATRLILNGARQAVLQAVKDDPHAIAWFRVTAANPCAFCAMIASRGAVFKTEQSAGFLAHNMCRCTAAAVWSESDANFVAQNNLLQQEWKRVTAGLSGRAARNAWRRYWYQQHPDAVGAPLVA